MLPQLPQVPEAKEPPRTLEALVESRSIPGIDRGPAAWGAGKRRSRELRPSAPATPFAPPSKALRPPVDLADATHRAEVSLATASAITEKALLEYREARSRGAAWLWARTTKRAGGSRTIVLFILHLWKNHTVEMTAHRKHVEVIIKRYTLRRRRFLVREWRRVARKERVERRRELEAAAHATALEEASARIEEAEARQVELQRHVAELERQLKDSREKEQSEEERKKIKMKNAQFRDRAEKAEQGLLALVGCTALDMDHTIESTARALFKCRTFDSGEDYAGAPRHADPRAFVAPSVMDLLALPRMPDSDDYIPDTQPRDLPERIVLDWANAAAKSAGTGGSLPAVAKSLPAYQPFADWHTTFVDGRQLARIVFGELEACLDSRALRGVETAEEIPVLPGATPKLWRRRLKDRDLLAYASAVRGRLARPKDLASYVVKAARELLDLPEGLLTADDIKGRDVDWHFPLLAFLMCKGGSRVGADPLYETCAKDFAGVSTRWRALRERFVVPAAKEAKLGAIPDAWKEIPAPDKKSLVELLPKTTRRSDHGGVGDLAQLAVDMNTLARAIATMEAAQWRGGVLWDRARNAVEHKCFAELSRRARIVPGVDFTGRVDLKD